MMPWLFLLLFPLVSGGGKVAATVQQPASGHVSGHPWGSASMSPPCSIKFRKRVLRNTVTSQSAHVCRNPDSTGTRS
ncbi:hypothetical protein V8C42DRAFT_331769 [Trichoderma barbatum]